MSFHCLSGGEKWMGLNVGNNASTGESDADIGSGHTVGEFRNGENVETAGSEEGGTDGTTKSFDGGTNGFKAIIGVLRNTGPGM